MKKILILLSMTIAIILNAETLFEVKDASDHTVLDVSTDGIRVMNYPDTIMVISSNAIQANISSSKGLSRSFSIATSTSKGSGIDLMRLTADSTRFWISDAGSGFGVAKQSSVKTLETNLLEVSTNDTKMREGLGGGKYTDFSPENMFLGLNSGSLIDSGVDNVFIGNYSGLNNTTGFQNTYIGVNAGRDNQTNFGNVYVGSYAGEENTNGGNTFIGMQAGRSSSGTNSWSNTYIGYTTGQNATGNTNTFIGMSSGVLAGAGSENVYLGQGAGYNTPDGNGNTYIGKGAGYGFNQNPGSDNVYIGKSAGYFSAGSGNVFIGKDSGFNETLSNKLYIANSGTSSPLIKGTFPNTDLSMNATDIYANGKITIKGGTAIGMTQAGTMTIGNFTGQSAPKIITFNFPKVFSSVPKITVTPKGANGANELFGVTVRDITTTNCVVMIYKLYPTAGGSWTQNLLADWVAWE